MVVTSFLFMNNYIQLDFTKLKPVNYNRKSSESEDKQMLSVVSQIEEAQRIAEYYKLPKFIQIFQEAKSAKKEFVRPQFGEMIAMIKSGVIDAIVCWKLDRLARNMTEGGMLIDLLSSGVLKAIITHDKVYYPTDNVLLMSVEFGQGKQFVKDLSINVKRGQTKKATLGIPHGVASLGFLNDKTEEKGNRKWLVDKERLPKIQQILKTFLTGEWSAGKLHGYATKDLKLTTVRRKRIGGELIQLSRIYEILTDPIYAGFFFYGGERYELDKELPRLITEDEHNKIKAILQRRNIPKTQTHDDVFVGFVSSPNGEYIGLDKKYQVICDCKNKFPYRDKTQCPQCGIEIDKMEKPKYLDYSYYYNITRKKKKLGVKSINSDKIMTALLADAKGKIPMSQKVADWARKFISELRDNEINENLLKEEIALKQSDEYEDMKRKMRKMLANELITEDEYKSDLRDLEERFKTSNKPTNTFDWTKRANEIIDLSQEFFDVMQNGQLKAKKSLLHRLGTNLVWDEEKVSVIKQKSVEKLFEVVSLMESEFQKSEPKNWLDMKSLNEKTSEFSPVFSTMLRR